MEVIKNNIIKSKIKFSLYLNYKMIKDIKEDNYLFKILLIIIYKY
jgi:hypothetical protein